MRHPAILLAVIALAGALAPAGNGDGTTDRSSPAKRSGLEIPGEIWRRALAGLERPGRRLGFTAEEMAWYSGRKHLLPTVENLFRDARTLPRFSGDLADSLVEKAAAPAEVVRICYGLTGAVAGRRAPVDPLDGASGSVEWFEGLSPAPTEEQRRAFGLLPPEAQGLLAALVQAVSEEGPWIARAFCEGAPPTDLRGDARALHDFAKAPLTEERSGQLATLRKESFAALDKLDRDYLAFGSVLLLARVTQALDAYSGAERRPVPPEFAGLTLETSIGTVRVYGAGDDVIEAPATISLDLGGNDRWRGRHGTPVRRTPPVGLAVDLGGDDAYDGGEAPAALACGLFGFGALIDLGGDDTYRCAESGLGCAWFGTGLLVDRAGNDRYETTSHWGQGTGYAGVGALVDLAGDDAYVIGFDGQGYGATLGTGLLLDVTGNDSYLARDDGNVSELYGGQSVSMAQGVGQGRRADLGDGHSLAGGFGVLVDGGGDDTYHATCWSHGAGYWWAVGILEDLGGDDTYRDGKYSLGAGAHFAIGVCADLSGDDAYDIGYAEAVNQYLGHARDGSIGVFFDGDGDDRYQLRAHCGGSGDLASIGLFWDRRGDDVYEVTAKEIGKDPSWGRTPPLGSSTFYGPLRSYRDDLETSGVFLDTGGKDEYLGEPGPWGNDRGWPSKRGERFRGYGLDVEWFAARAKER